MERRTIAAVRQFIIGGVYKRPWAYDKPCRTTHRNTLQYCNIILYINLTQVLKKLQVDGDF